MSLLKRGFLLVLVAAIFSAVLASGAEPGQLISNSQDWRDVYSVMLYGSFSKTSTGFLVSERHGSVFLNSVGKGNHIWIFSSKKAPYVVGYKAIVDGRGYSSEEFISDNINLDLAKLSEADSFIILDDSYGYNAVSVAPYAVATRSFVIFADKGNINKVASFLGSLPSVKAVVIYGHVDKEVSAGLKKFNPEVINKNGDRFANNIEIVRKYQKLTGSKQALFTNGEFLERELINGVEPVVFIGKNNIPDIVVDYFKESEIKVGVLVGNDLVGTATSIRRSLGISVFVKFAQSARASPSSISQVEGLDMFFLPTYSLDLRVQSVKYNSATGKLEVAIKNNVDQASYFKGTYTLRSGDASLTVGDFEPVFIDGNGLKTMVYDAPSLGEDISATIYIIYGESKNSLEKVIDLKMCPSCERKVQSVNIVDACDLKVEGVSYNTGKRAFVIDLFNPSEADCYLNAEVVDVIVSGERRDFASESNSRIDSGKRRQVAIAAELDEIDLADNGIVKVKAFFGERESSLIRMFEGEFELKVVSLAEAMMNQASFLLIPIIIGLVIALIWFIKKRKV